MLCCEERLQPFPVVFRVLLEARIRAEESIHASNLKNGPMSELHLKIFEFNDT